MFALNPYSLYRQNVRLTLIVPKEGSKVVVGFHSNTVGQCLVVQQADKVLINTDTAEENSNSKTVNVENDFNINCNDVNVETNSWDFNGGSFQGLIKIVDLTTKLNKTITELNDLRTKFNAHKHIGVSTGGGVSGIPDKVVSVFTVFNKNDYENTKIKH